MNEQQLADKYDEEERIHGEKMLESDIRGFKQAIDRWSNGAYQKCHDWDTRDCVHTAQPHLLVLYVRRVPANIINDAKCQLREKGLKSWSTQTRFIISSDLIRQRVEARRGSELTTYIDDEAQCIQQEAGERKYNDKLLACTIV